MAEQERLERVKALTADFEDKRRRLQEEQQWTKDKAAAEAVGRRRRTRMTRMRTRMMRMVGVFRRVLMSSEGLKTMARQASASAR